MASLTIINQTSTPVEVESFRRDDGSVERMVRATMVGGHVSTAGYETPLIRGDDLWLFDAEEPHSAPVTNPGAAVQAVISALADPNSALSKALTTYFVIERRQG